MKILFILEVFMEYFLENDYLIVKINSLGAEVKSVLKKNGYKEYMWYGDSKYWGRTSPVLFPFVGSLKNKKYTYEGIDYPMGQHGFARDMEFELSERTSDSITFTLNSNEDTLKKYPFNFVLKISYILNKSELTVAWKVENPNDRNLYFSIGAHPAFLCPIHGEKDKTGYTIYIENGSPKLAAISTLAHELTHIWQYLNWNDSELKKKYGSFAMLQIYEGMAKWVEIQYLIMINEVQHVL